MKRDRMKKTVHWMALMVLTASGNALAAGINSVMDLVDAKKISTLEQLLPQLPHDLRSNFVTVSQSRSLQEAAPDKPRVIMFGEDAKLIIAFNGAPLKGSDKLEI